MTGLSIVTRDREEGTTLSGLRARIAVRGTVQGVGFRPFVYRLARELELMGWVTNSLHGVLIEVEGGKEQLDAFLLRIEKERPIHSSIQSLEVSYLDPIGSDGFEIRHSTCEGHPTALVLPDIASCSDCVREIFDPANRRYLYPFTNCTNCGPRFSIIESLPYDRARTTMRIFEMCRLCRAEYEDPRDRRFHAQPNACSQCGPTLTLVDEGCEVLARDERAWRQAADLLKLGRVVALKGLGGFQLLVDARNDEAVVRLRDRKRREEKPFALMYPSIEAVTARCEVSSLEERLLLSSECPIVLLRRRSSAGGSVPPVAEAVAPGNPYLGVMLPYTPLHHMVMRELGFPVVATSGNRSDEPICTDNQEAFKRLQGIADAFLVHNRPIFRHVDDSVVRITLGREMVLRRARGYAPLPVSLKGTSEAVLAVGAHLKSVVAVSVPSSPPDKSRCQTTEVEPAAGWDAHDQMERCAEPDGQESQVFLSQHLGDLESSEAYRAFQKVIEDFRDLYRVNPARLACDLHPDYLSSQYARKLAANEGIPLVPIQHHYAHVAACMAENQLEAPVLGISWDGTGFGPDGSIWGGEFLLVKESTFARVAHLRRFRLPGGQAAIREPRRAALGVLYEMLGDALFDQCAGLRPLTEFSVRELTVLRQMLKGGANSPLTSSVGRLFDAVSSVLGIRHQVSYEGQAAMDLELALEPGIDTSYAYEIWSEGLLIVNWEPMMIQILSDLQSGEPVKTIATKFHNTLVETIVDVAKQLGEKRVVLTGGCFQNQYLLERTVPRLEADGFRPYWHQRVPPNDGGIALGQIYALSRAKEAGLTPGISAPSFAL
ncbi:MAG: carbamoyltransferase HypF [Acidobacteriota bacterium]